MSEEIVMIIPRDRTKPVQVEVNGSSGIACEERTRILEERLGGNVQREHKPEYYQEPVSLGQTVGGE